MLELAEHKKSPKCWPSFAFFLHLAKSGSFLCHVPAKMPASSKFQADAEDLPNLPTVLGFKRLLGFRV